MKLRMMKALGLGYLVFSIVMIQAQKPAYYNGIDFNQSVADVEQDLKSLITSTHFPLAYSATYPWIKIIDEDENNSNNVILMYSGQSISKNNTVGGGNTSNPEDWNREHVYPQTFINTTAQGDLHHLRACDKDINNNRGSQPFANGSGNYGNVSGGWYPGDEWKGDVARMIMYLVLRYDESWTDVGAQSMFLQWNEEDPVSSIEIQRNNFIYNAQGNRNPFIDQPYLATFLWGGQAAEDTWGWPNNVAQEHFASVSMLDNSIAFGEYLTLSADCSIDSENIKIHNVLGSEIKFSSDVMKSKQMNLQLPVDLKSGLYFVSVFEENQKVTLKFVVE